jgi:hypothetical protein
MPRQNNFFFLFFKGGKLNYKNKRKTTFWARNYGEGFLIWLEIVAASSALFKNQVATESHGPIPSPLATVKGRSFFGCCQRVETVARAFLATPGISPQKEKKKKKQNQKK